ncbi:MAG TPA: hypothetical protein ENI87_05085 [bacterium]|nr:hypothetical protein [bacterium]
MPAFFMALCAPFFATAFWPAISAQQSPPLPAFFAATFFAAIFFAAAFLPAASPSQQPAGAVLALALPCVAGFTTLTAGTGSCGA